MKEKLYEILRKMMIDHSYTKDEEWLWLLNTNHIDELLKLEYLPKKFKTIEEQRKEIGYLFGIKVAQANVENPMLIHIDIKIG